MNAAVMDLECVCVVYKAVRVMCTSVNAAVMDLECVCAFIKL